MMSNKQCATFSFIVQVSKRSNLELTGRTDGNIIVVFPNKEVVSENGTRVMLQPGDYTHVKVCKVMHVSLV